MESFSPSVRRIFEQPDRLDRFEQAAARAEAMKRDRVVPSEFSPIAKIPVKVRVLNQAALRRTLDLAGAFVRDTNAGSLAPAFVNARAGLETAFAALDVAVAVDRVLAKRDKAGLTALDERIMKGLVGSKAAHWGGEEIQAVNVLTIIDRFAKLVSPEIRTAYDDLSEHAHPNYLGTVGAYSGIDETSGVTFFIEQPLHVDPRKIGLPLSAMEGALNLMIAAIETFESKLSSFVLLCDEAIHDKGTWPSKLPYPRAVE